MARSKASRMSHSRPDSPAATLARLAADNEQHLRWLQFKFGASLSDEDLADILQEAHEEAIAALHGDRPPTFPDWARAVAWFRRVCANTAIDAIRRRDGRRASERTTRPTLVSLDRLPGTAREHDRGLPVGEPRLGGEGGGRR